MHILIHATYPRTKVGEVMKVVEEVGEGDLTKEVIVVTRPDAKYGIESHTIVKIEAGKEFQGVQETYRTMQAYNAVEGYAWQMDIVATPEEALPGGIWRPE